MIDDFHYFDYFQVVSKLNYLLQKEILDSKMIILSLLLFFAAAFFRTRLAMDDSRILSSPFGKFAMDNG